MIGKRKVGRPKKDSGNRKSVFFNVRMTPEETLQLDIECWKREASRSDLIREALQYYLKNDN